MEAIRKELGQLDGAADEGSVEDYRQKAEARQLPENVKSAIDREISKLERTSEQSPEHGWIRTWLTRFSRSLGARPPRTPSTHSRRRESSTRTTTDSRT